MHGSEGSRHVGLAFAHLNLRRNPFGQPSLEERAALAVVDLDDYFSRLARPGFVLQLIGDCGRGKSTCLHAINGQFPWAAYVCVCPGETPRLPRAHPFLLDEAQRLARPRRRKLFRRRGVSLALGTHDALTDELREAGLEVATERPDAGLDANRLARIVRRRIEWSRRGPGAVPALSSRAIVTLLDRYGSDVRAIEQSLYTVFQSLEEIGDVEV